MLKMPLNPNQATSFPGWVSYEATKPG